MKNLNENTVGNNETNGIYPHSKVKAILSSSAESNYSDKIAADWRNEITRTIANTSPLSTRSKLTNVSIAASVAIVVSVAYLFVQVLDLNEAQLETNRSDIVVDINETKTTKQESLIATDLALANLDLDKVQTAPLSTEYNAFLSDLEKIKSRITRI